MDKRIPAELMDESSALYVSEARIQMRAVDGRLQRLRKLAVWVLLGMFYAFPWLRWDGRQAVLFDLPARKFYVFGLNFWPQDFVLLAMLLIIAGMTLFFFTALAGRLWCGYACPQTVWTEVFVWIEEWTEGDRNSRMKLDASPWNRRKIVRRGARHALWIVFALWTGFTFIGFFTPIRTLAAEGPLGWSGWETFWLLFYAIATWGNAGFLREQVCKYMCPYARFQSAMFDRDTLIIAYDPLRGEPRGPRKRGLDSVLARARGLLPKAVADAWVMRAMQPEPAPNAATDAAPNTAQNTAQNTAPNTTHASARTRHPLEDLGDCIDCTLCVQVCPTGIDIRDGLQYECIACGACIDACNGVMDKVGYPRGLIRYASQNAVDGKPTRVLRPRIIIYAALLLTLLGGFAWGVGNRSTLIAEVQRDRNALYRETADGVENDYLLKIANKTVRPQRYRIALAAPDGIALRGAPAEVRAGAEEIVAIPIIAASDAPVAGRRNIRFIIIAGDGARVEVDSSFFGPTP